MSLVEPFVPTLVEARQDGFLISTDKARLDLDAIHAELSASYWSPGIPRSFVERAIRASLCFGVYEEAAGAGGMPAAARPRQVGFARIISDFSSFAYMADVYITASHRQRGLSKWLVQTMIAHPDLQNLRRFCLMTRDAHGLYARFGFGPMPDATRFMEKLDRDVYKRLASVQHPHANPAR
ncbi:MAG: GNAT family N-acetyltransferase [Phycisphaerales bacterium]